ncbi:hypothetical protein [Paractinoplanes toevensis]|uniref:hypothetical protein n=1 Tax=Paractinoplanes toevensis TaxID=571911 RepID=UPI001BB32CED|nr:hypothetical protein [Actinoplanes toevensis]
MGDIAATLAGHDPITAAPDYDLIAAALTWLRGGTGDPEERLLWGRWAYRSAETLTGRLHPLWRTVATVYRRVLAEQGLSTDVVRVCEQRVDVARELGDPADLLIHQCSLAAALHTDGSCDLADQQSRNIFAAWAAESRASTIRADQIVVLTSAVIAAGCGQTSRAVRLLCTYPDVLAGLDDDARRTAARWLALTETTHPARCLHQPPPPLADQANREQVWAGLLDPAGSAPARSSRDRPEHGSAGSATTEDRR